MDKKSKIAELLSLDLTPRQIAERLGISMNSVYTYIKRIKTDLGWQAQ